MKSHQWWDAPLSCGGIVGHRRHCRSGLSPACANRDGFRPLHLARPPRLHQVRSAAPARGGCLLACVVPPGQIRIWSSARCSGSSLESAGGSLVGNPSRLEPRDPGLLASVLPSVGCGGIAPSLMARCFAKTDTTFSLNFPKLCVLRLENIACVGKRSRETAFCLVL